MADPVSVPVTLHEATRLPHTIEAALPRLVEIATNIAANVLLAILILAAGWIISRWLAAWLDRLLTRNRRIDATIKPFLINCARYTVLAITLVAVLSRFGVQTASIIALLGAAGLAIGLALQGTLSNVASGVMLLVLRPFRIGDYVVVAGGTGGTVREIGLFNTVLTDADQIYIAIPNTQIFSNTITNYTRENTRRVNITIRIDYDDDIDKAQNILLEIMQSDARVLKDPAPSAVVGELAPSSVNLIVRCFTLNTQYWDTLCDMQKTIKLRFDAAGIVIPFPQQTDSPRIPRRPAPAAGGQP